MLRVLIYSLKNADGVRVNAVELIGHCTCCSISDPDSDFVTLTLHLVVVVCFVINDSLRKSIVI